MGSTPHTVAVLGASANPERYAFRAIELLRAHGHRVLPVHPTLETVAGLPVVKSLADLPPVDTLTLYVGAARLPAMAADIVDRRPGRVIFNPGTESPELQAALDHAGIPWLEACTLVLLQTGQF
jgi:predicted CoA-binding protein